MLEIDGIDSFYGDNHILFDVSLTVEEGEVVSLVGRNGVGKTTTLRSIMDLAEVRSGTITYRNEPITDHPTEEIADRGIGYIPEEREIFTGLTVHENLKISVPSGVDADGEIASVYETFPKLEDLRNSKGGHLSGGEQQMLAIARALVGNNDLLLIDEPTEGLAPQIATDVRDAIAELKGEKTILLVEQSIDFIYSISDRLYGIKRGRIVYEGSPTDARESGAIEDVLAVN